MKNLHISDDKPLPELPELPERVSYDHDGEVLDCIPLSIDDERFARYLVSPTVSKSVVDFRVLEVVSWGINDMECLTAKDHSIISIKWDGGCHCELGNSRGYMYLGGVSQYEKNIRMMAQLFGLAIELMGNDFDIYEKRDYEKSFLKDIADCRKNLWNPE